MKCEMKSEMGLIKLELTNEKGKRTWHVYILESMSEEFKGTTYVGMTNNISKRLR